MFIVSLCYKKALSEVDKHIGAHVDFLNKYYAAGIFIASGRKEPRTGGIIIANAASKEEIVAIMTEDPFYVTEVADYDVIEFLPTMSMEQFKPFIL